MGGIGGEKEIMEIQIGGDGVDVDDIDDDDDIVMCQ